MNNSINFINEIFGVLGFDASQKKAAESDLNEAIAAKMANILIASLPESGKLNLNNEEKSILESFREHFSVSFVHEAEQRAVGEVIIAYLEHMLQAVEQVKKKEIQRVLEKYKTI